MIEIILWLSIVSILYCYVGYPVLLHALARIAPRRVDKRHQTDLPKVTLLIAAYNEAHVIADKLRNALALDYPADKLEIVVGSDGSTDGTDAVVAPFAAQGVKLYHFPQRRGKVSVLNDVVREASGEIILFSDARQLYFPDAILQLVANLADPEVGCASGGLEILPVSRKSVGEGVGFYRVYEQNLRNLEAQVHSMLGATGAIYAIRKSLYVPPPADTVLDDFEIPMRIVLRGYRAVYEPMAVAYDVPPANPQEEISRKIRTLAGNYQSLTRLWRLLLPLRSPVAWQLFSHKVLRLMVPFLMIGIFFLNLELALHSRAYLALFAAQIVFYAGGAVGALLRTRGRLTKMLGISYTFVILNYAALLGCLRFLAGRQQATWKKAAVEQ